VHVQAGEDLSEGIVKVAGEGAALLFVLLEKAPMDVTLALLEREPCLAPLPLAQ
jgi:hypothetical protein